MEPLQEFNITLHYTELYEGRQRSYAHKISVRARSFGEAVQMADDYCKDLSGSSATLFGRRPLRVQIDLQDAQASSEAAQPDLSEVDPLV